MTACVGGAAGGAFIGLFSMLGTTVGSTAIGPSGRALFPLLNGNHPLGTTLALYSGGLLVGYVVGFVATYFWGFSQELLEEFNLATAPDAAVAAVPTAWPTSAPTTNAPEPEAAKV